MKKILSVALLISVLSLAACGTNDATVTKNEVKTPNAKVDNNWVEAWWVKVDNNWVNVDKNEITDDKNLSDEEKEALKVMEDLLNE